MAEKKRTKVSGAHVTPRRKISATLEQFVAMDRVAAVDGLTWGQWALSILLARIKYKSPAAAAQLRATRADVRSRRAFK